MTTLICVLAAGLVGIGGVTLGWWLGYHAGREDGQCGVCQCYPWSEATRDQE